MCGAFLRFGRAKDGDVWMLVAILLAFAFPFGGVLHAGQACSVPSLVHPQTAGNIFSTQQEQELGEIEANWLERSYHVIQDDGLTAHLNAIGHRVLSEFPSAERNVRIILIDTPDADSFSAGTARIYITRKMVSMLQSDDELAGLLGHELDHVARHQNAIVVTRLFHELLGVKAVTDRKDIEVKYGRLLSSMDLDKNAARAAAVKKQQQEESHQYEADRVALYAAASAGFSPKAFVQFFDRIAQTQGRTGNFLTDFLGATSPDERRLREIYKSLRRLPRWCREISPLGVSTEFLTWQADVMAYPSVARR